MTVAPPAETAPRKSIILASHHLAIFVRLGITPDLLAAAGIHSVTDCQARDEGFTASVTADLSGFSIPYFDPVTGHRLTAVLRRDHPDLDATGKTERKYVFPYGDRHHLYFPPGAATLLADASVPVVFVESVKAALALTALEHRTGKKCLAIATGGCWGWRGKVGIEAGPSGAPREVRGPLPDLDLVDWTGRRDCIICFDANSLTNARVRAARRAFSDDLTARGASARIADLPQLDGVNGPDDLIALAGDEAMWALLDSARPFAEAMQKEAEAAVASLETDTEQDPVPILETIAAIFDPLRRSLLVGRVAGLKIPGLTKKAVEQALKDRDAKQSTAAAKKQAEATELARIERLLRIRVNPTELILELESYYAQRRHLPEGAAFIEALFAMNTYTYGVFDTTPYLLYDSATGGCGKTTTMERHEHICSRAYFGVDPSAAALYRRIDRDNPTFLLDEAKVLQIHGERGQELLALFDAGYKRGATVSRCEDHGEGLRDFNVYSPKVLARIGSFRGTLLDRGIVIHLEKARGLRQRRRSVLQRQTKPLKDSLEAYALQFRAELERIYQSEPDEGFWAKLSGREEEVWGPLLCHARLAGPEMESRAVKVALQYSRNKAKVAIAEDRLFTRAEEALEVLQVMSGETFSPRELVPALSEKESWGEYLADRKTDKARVTAVGTFFSNFRLSRKHTTTGTEYNRLEAIDSLQRHMPETEVPSEDGVKVSGGVTTASDSIESATDTSQSESSQQVSAAKSVDRKAATGSADTLTPQYLGPVNPIEEEL